MLPAGTYTSINADRKAVLSQSFCLCSRQSQRFLFSVGIRISMRKYFTQYLNDKLQTSLPVCYLAIHLTQNTLPQKMTQIKIQISLWNLICRKCSKVTVLTASVVSWYLPFLHHLCQVQASWHKSVKNFLDDVSGVSFHLKYRPSLECGLSKLIELSALNTCFYSC